MPKYVIERDIPKVGGTSAKDLMAISQKSCGVIEQLGPKIQWIHSYVTGDKIYCVYHADSPEIIREHAKRGGFPANRIEEVKAIIDPASSEQTAMVRL
jgi:hypothetical protein